MSDDRFKPENQAQTPEKRWRYANPPTIRPEPKPRERVTVEEIQEFLRRLEKAGER